MRWFFHSDVCQNNVLADTIFGIDLFGCRMFFINILHCYPPSSGWAGLGADRFLYESHTIISPSSAYAHVQLEAYGHQLKYSLRRIVFSYAFPLWIEKSDDRTKKPRFVRGSCGLYFSSFYADTTQTSPCRRVIRQIMWKYCIFFMDFIYTVFEFFLSTTKIIDYKICTPWRVYFVAGYTGREAQNILCLKILL